MDRFLTTQNRIIYLAQEKQAKQNDVALKRRSQVDTKKHRGDKPLHTPNTVPTNHLVPISTFEITEFDKGQMISDPSASGKAADRILTPESTHLLESSASTRIPTQGYHRVDVSPLGLPQTMVELHIIPTASAEALEATLPKVRRAKRKNTISYNRYSPAVEQQTLRENLPCKSRRIAPEIQALPSAMVAPPDGRGVSTVGTSVDRSPPIPGEEIQMSTSESLTTSPTSSATNKRSEAILTTTQTESPVFYAPIHRFYLSDVPKNPREAFQMITSESLPHKADSDRAAFQMSTSESLPTGDIQNRKATHCGMQVHCQ